MHFKSKEEGKYQESIQLLHLIQDTIWESDKNMKTSHIREPKVNRFPTGNHNINKHDKSHAYLSMEKFFFIQGTCL